MVEPHDIFEALFVGDDVEPSALADAMAAGREDRELRARFNELALADRALGGDFEARSGEAMFLGALDAMLSEEAEEQAPQPISLDEHRARRSTPRWALAAVALIAVGATVVLFGNEPADDEFQARASVASTRDYVAPQVEVFCVERDANGEVTFRGAEESALATVRCPIGAEIKLAVRNADAELRFVALFASQGQDLRWYGPTPVAPEPIAIHHGDAPLPVGETIRLDVNHEPGTVRVVGVFTEKPMAWQQLQTWASTRSAELWDGPLTVSDGIAVRTTFEVEP